MAPVTMFRKFQRVAALAGFALLPVFSAAQAPEWPSKPVRIVSPYAAGGVGDVLFRITGPALEAKLGQRFLIDNKTGAAGNIGTSEVINAKPDGYTLLLSSNSTFTLNPALYPKLTYDAATAYESLGQVGSVALSLVVHPSVRATSVQQLVADIKAAPDRFVYGSFGNGTSSNFAGAMFNSAAGVNMTHVPYKGSAPAMQAMLGGEIDALFDNVPNVLPHIKAGKMKVIGVSGLQRSFLLPDTPTVAEAGVPGFEVNVWFGMQVPAGTPRPVVDKLNRDIVSLLKEPDVIQRFRNQGVEVVASTPEQFATLVRNEINKWTQLIKEASIRIE